MEFVDTPWNGKSIDGLELQIFCGLSRALPDVRLCYLS
jgi:hypothetical protein